MNETYVIGGGEARYNMRYGRNLEVDMRNAERLFDRINGQHTRYELYRDGVHRATWLAGVGWDKVVPA